jgi:hypothetical protein
METGHRTYGDRSPITGDIIVEIKNILETHETKIENILANINSLSTSTAKIDDFNKLKDSVGELKSNSEKQITELSKRVDDLCKEKLEKSGKPPIKTKWWSYLILLFAITVFAALFFWFAIWLNIEHRFGISDSSIVIAFIGILATFVVVSNYLQVLEVKREFASEVEKAKGELRVELRDATNTAKEELRGELTNVTDTVKLELFVDTTYKIARTTFDGTTFESQFDLYTQAFVASCALYTDYSRKEYEENIKFHFGVIEKLMDGTKSGQKVNFSEVKLGELIGMVSAINDKRAEKIYKFLLKLRKNGGK